MKIGHVSLEQDELAAFCNRWEIAELAVFGSVLRSDFGPDSDIDFLVTWKPGAAPRSYFRLFAMRRELEGLVGREVDVAERHLLEQSYNEFRRAAILGSAATVYAAA